MSYKAHTWATGDTITADLLNALEQGAASGQIEYVDTALNDGTAVAGGEADGTVAIDNNDNLFVVASGKFTLKGSLKGPKGDTGAAGKDGATGAAGKDGSDAKQIKAGTLNEDKNGVLTGATVTFTDNTTLDFTINKATA